MKKLIVTCALMASVCVGAFAQSANPAYETYSTKANMTSSSKISWEVVDDVPKACSEDRIRSIGKPYPYKVLACSNWHKNIFNQYVCRIITGKNVNNEIVGHEIRHCFQGNFHPL